MAGGDQGAQSIVQEFYSDILEDTMTGKGMFVLKAKNRKATFRKITNSINIYFYLIQVSGQKLCIKCVVGIIENASRVTEMDQIIKSFTSKHESRFGNLTTIHTHTITGAMLVYRGTIKIAICESKNMKTLVVVPRASTALFRESVSQL